MSKPTILIVDDSPENLNILKGLLSDDYNLKAAPNGNIAIKIESIIPHSDLILLDIMMPVMDGYEVCKTLKEKTDTEHIPIVFLTAMSEEKDEAKGLKLGAIKNLLSNSLKFTPEGSAVEMSLEKINGSAVYRVNDEGPGIPEEFRDKIFSKFYQISSKEVKKQSGVGLGLAFCRMVAEAMEAVIGVEDRPESKPGSSFYIKLAVVNK